MTPVIHHITIRWVGSISSNPTTLLHPVTLLLLLLQHPVTLLLLLHPVTLLLLHPVTLPDPLIYIQ